MNFELLGKLLAAAEDSCISRINRGTAKHVAREVHAAPHLVRTEQSSNNTAYNLMMADGRVSVMTSSNRIDEA